MNLDSCTPTTASESCLKGIRPSARPTTRCIRGMTRRAKLAPRKRKTCGLFLLSPHNGNRMHRWSRKTVATLYLTKNANQIFRTVVARTATTPMRKPAGYCTRPHPVTFHIYTLLHFSYNTTTVVLTSTTTTLERVLAPRS